MQIYDNYGDSVLEAHGKHVDVEAETTEEEGNPPSSVTHVAGHSAFVSDIG